MRAITLILLLLAMKPLFAQNDAQSLVSKLTLDEKVALVVGAGVDMSVLMGKEPPEGTPEEKVPGAAGTSKSIERLSIPEIVFSDGPAGIRINLTRKSAPDKKFYVTAFPNAIMLASTFNVDVLEKVGTAFGNECNAYGIDILLAPALNIQRNPLGGRNYEYYSEDPLISGKMASAFTKGVQSQGVGVSIKHFAANNQETNRAQLNTIVTERALREIYLKGFEIAVKESNPWTIMSSYNKINDVYTSESADLLTTVLRKEWGFKGFVMSDWFGGQNAVEQMKAGNDLIMPGKPEQSAQILQAVKDGTLSMKDLDRNVVNILNIYQKTNSYLKHKASGTPDFEQNKTISKEAATEGMVLLKNNKNVLPLNVNNENIALFGNASYSTIAGGTGSGDVNKAYTISISEGLEKAGFKLNVDISKATLAYLADKKSKQQPKKFILFPDELFDEIDWTTEQLNTFAEKNTIAVFTISRTSGEFFDRKEENDFKLKDAENQFLKKLCEAFHKKNKSVVVLLNIGGVIETASWKDLPDAILSIWQPGQEGGNAVADILSGKVNPSGKLSMTFPVNYADVYSSKNFPCKQLDVNQKADFMFGAPSEVVYEEDIFVGYRYFDTYKVAASFPFGFGLSYTTFSFSGLKTEKLTDGSIKVNCSVTNTGKTAGKEVVQLYVSAPEGKLKKPSKELKAFAKTKLLQAGEKQDFEFTLTPYQLSSYDTEISAWIAEKGDYKVFVGSSVIDLPLSSVIQKATTDITLKANKVLTETRKINILH